MNFSSVKEMEATIASYTNVEQLEGDISFMSQGVRIFLENLGTSTNMGANEAIYMGRETADSLRVRFEGSGNSIKVIEIKLTRG